MLNARWYESPCVKPPICRSKQFNITTSRYWRQHLIQPIRFRLRALGCSADRDHGERIVGSWGLVADNELAAMRAGSVDHCAAFAHAAQCQTRFDDPGTSSDFPPNVSHACLHFAHFRVCMFDIFLSPVRSIFLMARWLMMKFLQSVPWTC